MADCDGDSIFAITFFLSTSSIDIIFVFCFSRNSSISFRKVLLLSCVLFTIGFGFSNIDSTFFGSCFCGAGVGWGFGCSV